MEVEGIGNVFGAETPTAKSTTEGGQKGGGTSSVVVDSETTNQVSRQEFLILQDPPIEEIIPQSSWLEDQPNSKNSIINLSIQKAGFMDESFEFQIQEIDAEIRRFDKDKGEVTGENILEAEDHFLASNLGDF